MMKGKSLVIFSGGLDSTVALNEIVRKYGAENVKALSFKYGQKHQSTELKCAKAVAKRLEVEHEIMDISVIFNGLQSELLGENEITKKSYAEQLEEKSDGVVDTYVPYRNGIMTAIATAKAFDMVNGTDLTCSVVLGAHSDDAAGNAYPDCSEDFLYNNGRAINLGTSKKVVLLTPFSNLHKQDIVSLGAKYNAPMELSWSCYDGGKLHCGTCGTCLDRKKAFIEAGVKDPTKYKGE